MKPAKLQRLISKTKKGTIVACVWNDAWAPSDRGWVDDVPAEMVKRTVTVASTGFLLGRTKHQVLLAGSVVDNGDMGGVMVIPRAWIQHWETR